MLIRCVTVYGACFSFVLFCVSVRVVVCLFGPRIEIILHDELLTNSYY